MSDRPDVDVRASKAPSGLQYLVTPSEVADVVGVGRSTVSNWRTRHEAFPKPVPRGKGQYNAEEILDWVSSPDSPVAGYRPPSPGWWWAKAVEAFHAGHIGAPVRGYLGALVLLNGVLVHGVGSVDPAPSRWSSLVAAVDPVSALAAAAERIERAHRPFAGLLVEPLSSVDVSATELTELLRRLDEVGADGSVAMFEEVLRRTAESALGRPEVGTPAEVATLMCRLSGIGPDSIVLDPTAGEGAILLAAAREAAVDGSTTDLRGQELDVANWRIATSRFLVHGVSADLGEPGLDSIREDQWPDLRADAVLVDPPVGGTDVPSPLLWVDHAIRHLGPGGRAVISLPAYSIADMPSARRSTDPHLVARLDGLLHDGHVEGVVVTPRRVRSDVVGPMTLWVVRRDPSPGREVIVVAPLEKRTRVRTSPADIPLPTDDIVAAFESWRERGEPTPAKERPAVLVRSVPARRVIATLAEAVGDVLPPPSVPGTARAQDPERERRRLREVHIKRLVELVERNLEALWEKDREEYMAVREAINAIRRLR